MSTLVKKAFLNPNDSSISSISTRVEPSDYFEIQISASIDFVCFHGGFESLLPRLDVLLNHLSELRGKMVEVSEFHKTHLKLYTTKEEAFSKIEEVNSNPAHEMFHGLLHVVATKKKFKVCFK